MGRKRIKYQSAYTLLEVMVVMSIVAILAAIAIPSYERYTIRAAQAQAKADMLGIAGQLENYRGKQLSYANFTLEPKYNDAAGVFNIPYDSTVSNYKYQIRLLDLTAPTVGNVLGDRVPLNSSNATGRGWVMIAVPQQSATAALKRANYLMITSDGIRCMTPESSGSKTYSLDKNSTNCLDALEW